MMVIISSLLREGDVTGVNTHFENLASYLASTGRKVMIVTPFTESRALVYPTFSIRRILDKVSGSASVWWYRYWHYFFLRRALSRVLQNNTKAVIYSQCPLSAWAALKARKNKDQHVVLAVHFNISQADEWVGKGKITKNDKLYETIRRREAEILPAVDGLVFVSDFMRKQLCKRIPSVNSIVSAVIPNCIHEPKLDRIKKKPFTDLITIGTLEPRKNQVYVLYIVEAAKRKGHTYTLTMVGDGPDRSMLIKLAKSLGISDQVNFIGQVKRAADWLPEHRVYIHTAHLESCPFVIVEALATGLPILAVPEGGIPEQFDNGVEGCYLPRKDSEKAAECLISILEDATSYESMKAASIIRFNKDYTMQSVSEKLYKFLLSA